MEVCNLPNKIICPNVNCWLTKPCRLVSNCMIRIYNLAINEFSCMCNNDMLIKPVCETVSISPSISPTYKLVGHSVEDASKQSLIDNIGYIMLSISVLIILIMLYYRECLKRYFSCCNKNSRIINTEEDNDEV
jgi:hypothetical protein